MIGGEKGVRFFFVGTSVVRVCVSVVTPTAYSDPRCFLTQQSKHEKQKTLQLRIFSTKFSAGIYVQAWPFGE
jgi:hypothetical protein